jgi:hypothetical protein
MIPKTGWRDMESAPKDGTIIFVVSHLYGKTEGPKQVQSAQWLCDPECKDWQWRRPWSAGFKVYADGWMHVEEFYEQCRAETDRKYYEDAVRKLETVDDETPAGMSALNAAAEELDFDL